MNIKLLSTLALIALLQGTLFSQNQPWKDVPEASLRNPGTERWIVPAKYRTLELDVALMEKTLRKAPARFNGDGAAAIISLPMPDGSFEDFAIQEAPIMEAGLAANFPEIKTFSGQGVNDPGLAVYLDLTPAGFHGMVLGAGRSFFIDPYFRGGRSHYVCYDRRDLSPTGGHVFACPKDSLRSGQTASEEEKMPSENMAPVNGRNAAITLRTYRVAMAATGEYTAYHGSAANALAAITTTLNRVRGVYETELAITFTLVADNMDIIYTDASTDPYSGDISLVLGENQAAIDTEIGNTNYDIGHLAHLNTTGGVAGVGVACRTGLKAWGMTAHTDPKGDPYDIDYVAHEMGHQFGANHTFNGNLGSCGGGNRNAATAYEPNSGTSLMAYGGICGSQSIQYNSESHFHQASLQQITTYVTTGLGSGCPATSASGNNSPTVEADPHSMGGKYIPTNTPFELTASGTDADGNPVTYCWEQWDLGAAGTASASASGPIFRSYFPTTSPTRSFPRLSDILDNSGSIGEYKPSITRSLKFKCTVRDNQAAGGGTAVDSITIQVTNSAADFAIASQNTSSNEEGAIVVNWNVGNTTASPVSCANVDILLSLDGGQTFSALVSGTTNDGSQEINLPNTATGQGRIKVKCSDNVFFDLNNADLRIVPDAATCEEEVTNSTFSAGASGWTQSSTVGQTLIANWGEGYSSANSAWLGYENDETSAISQTIALPSNPHFAKLEMWYKLIRFDCGGDVLTLKVNNVTLQTFSLCNNDAGMDWKRELIDLAAYAGTSPSIKIELVNNGEHPTDAIIGKVACYTCVGGSFAPLPVEMVGFQAVASGKGADLTWQTQSETENMGFEIEHQTGDSRFMKIGFVAGAGNVSEGQNYQFNVPQLSPGAHFFRLRQMDFDGQSNYSPVRSVLVAGDGSHLTVFPNPTNGLVSFNLLLAVETDVRLEVLDATGRSIRPVAEGRFAEGHFTFDANLEGLPRGVYFYRLTGGGLEENGRLVLVGKNK